MRPYKLILQSYNSTTTIKVDLTLTEYNLLKQISDSLEKQHAQNTLFIKPLIEIK